MLVLSQTALRVDSVTWGQVGCPWNLRKVAVDLMDALRALEGDVTSVKKPSETSFDCGWEYAVHEEQGEVVERLEVGVYCFVMLSGELV